MPLTRNLYREDEMIAALRLAIARGRANEAVFWVQEGLESDMDVQILQTLLFSWLYNVGLGHTEWLGWFLQGLQAETAFTEESIIALTVSLTNSVKAHPDSTVFALLAIGMQEFTETPEDRLVFSQKPIQVVGAITEHEVALIRAIQQGKFAYAWKLAAPLWDSGRADHVLQMMGSPKFPLEILGAVHSETFLWPFRALSLLIAFKPAVLHKPFGPHPVPDPNNLALWAERKKMPMRERRAYTVPPECLYSYTERGALKRNETTDSELTSGLEDAMDSSIFWSEHSDVYRDDGLIRETFFKRYFSTDIPDEWSLADRAKSHGFGATPVGSDSAAQLKMCLHRFHRNPSKLIWRGLERGIDVLVSMGCTESSFHEHYSSNRASVAHVSAWDMSAVKKELEVIC